MRTWIGLLMCLSTWAMAEDHLRFKSRPEAPVPSRLICSDEVNIKGRTIRDGDVTRSISLLWNNSDEPLSGQYSVVIHLDSGGAISGSSITFHPRDQNEMSRQFAEVTELVHPSEKTQVMVSPNRLRSKFSFTATYLPKKNTVVIGYLERVKGKPGFFYADKRFDLKILAEIPCAASLTSEAGRP